MPSDEKSWKEILKRRLEKSDNHIQFCWIQYGSINKSFYKEEVQKSLPEFEKLLNQHIKNQIKTIKLGDFFASSFGWRSDGNFFNRIMSDNADLIDKKIKKYSNKTNHQNGKSKMQTGVKKSS